MNPMACSASKRMRAFVSPVALSRPSSRPGGTTAAPRASGPASNASCARLRDEPARLSGALPSLTGSARKNRTSASIAANRTRRSGSTTSGETASAAGA